MGRLSAWRHGSYYSCILDVSAPLLFCYMDRQRLATQAGLLNSRGCSSQTVPVTGHPDWRFSCFYSALQGKFPFLLPRQRPSKSLPVHHPWEFCRLHCRASLCRIYGGQRGTGTGSSLSTAVFPRQRHSTSAPYAYGIYIRRCINFASHSVVKHYPTLSLSLWSLLGWLSNATCSFSHFPQLQSQPQNQLSWLKCFIFSLSPPRQVPRQ